MSAPDATHDLRQTLFVSLLEPLPHFNGLLDLLFPLRRETQVALPAVFSRLLRLPAQRLLERLLAEALVQARALLNGADLLNALASGQLLRVSRGLAEPRILLLRLNKGVFAAR